MSLEFARLTGIRGRGRLADSGARAIFRHRTALSSPEIDIQGASLSVLLR
jgi:hypothetical protein